MDRRLNPRRWQRRRRRRLARLILVLVVVLIVALLVTRLLPRHTRTAERSLPIPTHAQLYKKTGWLRAGEAWTAAEAEGLHRNLAQIAGDSAFPATTAIIVADGRDGHVLYSRNAFLPLAPGSTVKLITAAAALNALGPGHRFSTSIVTNGATDGTTLSGNVWLVGGGDPELTSDDVRRGIHALELAGIASISGNAYVDGSRYGPDVVTASWLQDDLQYGWAAPASALCLDGGSVQFTITPREGTQADVAVDPPGERVIASVDTVASTSDNTLTIDRLPDGSGYMVRGQIPYGAPQKYWRAVPHPTKAAAVSFLAMLRLAGINVSGYARAAQSPEQSATLWSHSSRTLDRIVRQMFLLSDNHYAEELLRAVGWNATGLGTLENSLAAERAFMHEIAIPASGVELVDGSGLSPQNRLTAASLAATLRLILNLPMPEPAFVLLPRAGIEGTVAARQLAPQARGRVFAKDGYIDGASSIAGYVITAHHGPVVFAMLVNNWEHGLDAVWDAEDRMLDTIAER